MTIQHVKPVLTLRGSFGWGVSGDHYRFGTVVFLAEKNRVIYDSTGISRGEL